MNKILLINKEKGYTSFDVCNKLKRVFNTKRIGHTGTLDPNAEGLLMIMVNASCKILPYIKHAKKTYIATLKLGIKTDTGDIWGNVVENAKYDIYSYDYISEVLNSFLGASKQIPPLASAISVDGKRLYELHRAKIEYTPKARDIFIHTINLLEYKDDTIVFEVVCSAGTYIRSLCEDIAKKLNTVGCMSSLTRTKIDDFKIEDSYSIDNVINNDYKYYSNKDILKKYYRFIEYPDSNHIINGKKINIECSDDIIIITNNDNVLAAYQREDNNVYKCKRGLL